MSDTLVMKFGGTSVGTAEAMQQVVQIIAAARGDWPRLVVVTSALSGVTDLLLETARAAAGARRSAEPDGVGLRVRDLRKRHTDLACAVIAAALKEPPEL